MANGKIQVLVIDDDPKDLELVRIQFDRIQCSSYELFCASSSQDARGIMQTHSLDICLLDYCIGAETGLDLVREFLASGFDIPFVLLTGMNSHKLDVEAMNAGVADFLCKNELKPDLLERSVRYCLERHRIQKEIQERESWFRHLFDRSQDGIVVVDEGGVIRTANPAACRWLGFEPGGAAGRDFGFPLRSLDPVEICLHPPGGRPLTVELRISSICWRGDACFLVSMRDITNLVAAELKRANEALQHEIRHHKETSQRLAEANSCLQVKHIEIQDFYHTLSHGLKSPLTSTREFIGIVLDGLAGSLNATQKEYLEIARQGCDRLRRCLDDLLDATRLETGKLGMDKKAGDLKELLERVTASFQEVAEAKNVRLKCEVVQQLPVAMFDEFRITQVVTNLLDNALRVTPAGGSIVCSAENAESFPGYVQVSVQDTGCGIRAEDLDRIFDPLHRVKKVDEGVKQGFGLGLYLCRELIRLHGGEIIVESHEGEGATFSFLLETTDCPVKARILIVEEDELARAGLDRELRGQGYTACLAGHGSEALQLLQEERFDLLMMDLGMHQADGCEFLTQVRARQPSIPIILHTGKIPHETMSRIMRLSPFTVLMKPCSTEVLADTIRNVLKQHETAILRKKPQGWAARRSAKGVPGKAQSEPIAKAG